MPNTVKQLINEINKLTSLNEMVVDEISLGLKEHSIIKIYIDNKTQIEESLDELNHLLEHEKYADLLDTTESIKNKYNRQEVKIEKIRLRLEEEIKSLIDKSESIRKEDQHKNNIDPLWDNRPDDDFWEAEEISKYKENIQLLHWLGNSKKKVMQEIFDKAWSKHDEDCRQRGINPLLAAVDLESELTDEESKIVDKNRKFYRDNSGFFSQLETNQEPETEETKQEGNLIKSDNNESSYKSALVQLRNDETNIIEESLPMLELLTNIDKLAFLEKIEKIRERHSAVWEKLPHQQGYPNGYIRLLNYLSKLGEFAANATFDYEELADEFEFWTDDVEELLTKYPKIPLYQASLIYMISDVLLCQTKLYIDSGPLKQEPCSQEEMDDFIRDIYSYIRPIVKYLPRDMHEEVDEKICKGREQQRKEATDEIRKNSYLLAQGKRDRNSFFNKLPDELLVKISAATGSPKKISLGEANKIAADNLKRPETKQTMSNDDKEISIVPIK